MGMILEKTNHQHNKTTMASTSMMPDQSSHIAVSWYNFPLATKSFALILDDPETSKDQVYFVAYNMPLSRGQLPTNFGEVEGLVDGTTFGINDFNRLGFELPQHTGPQKTLRVRVYALKKETHFEAGLTRTELLRRIEGKVIDVGKLSITYRQH